MIWEEIKNSTVALEEKSCWLGIREKQTVWEERLGTYLFNVSSGKSISLTSRRGVIAKI